jgi:hypothetical protein
MKKKMIFAGMIVILVMMFTVTCEAVVPVEADEEIQWTDVEYSKDGSEITLYVDGTKPIPVTKADRAVNKEIAMMVFDYFEVIFVGATAANVARTAWELGQSAGIADLPRVAYADTSPGAAANAGEAATNIAAMFVGKNSDKTLLGVGRMTAVNGVAGQDCTVAGLNRVTFSISAIQSGLLGFNERVEGTTGLTNPVVAVTGVVQDSFNYAASGAAGYVAKTVTNAPERQTLGGVQYPYFVLPENPTPIAFVNANYTFGFRVGAAAPINAVGYFSSVIRHINDPLEAVPIAQKRTPRFMEGGSYREPKERWTATCKLAFNPDTYGANTTGFTNPVPLQFTPKGSGIFSFYLQIPVYLLSKTANATAYATGGTNWQRWYIRTGVGSELYSLDDGIANGGCCLMMIGGSGVVNWINIEWQWI